MMAALIHVHVYIINMETLCQLSMAALTPNTYTRGCCSCIHVTNYTTIPQTRPQMCHFHHYNIIAIASTCNCSPGYDPTLALGIGSMVQVSDPPRFGVIQWIGKLQDMTGTCAGIEMVS